MPGAATTERAIAALAYTLTGSGVLTIGRMKDEISRGTPFFSQQAAVTESVAAEEDVPNAVIHMGNRLRKKRRGLLRTSAA